MAQSIVFAVSHRLQPIVAALICLAAAQLIVASCTPEPVPYATRVAIQR